MAIVNRWLPQTTCADCRESLGNLLPPSPPAEKATARQDQARHSRAHDRARRAHHVRRIVPRWVQRRAAQRPTMHRNESPACQDMKHLGRCPRCSLGPGTAEKRGACIGIGDLNPRSQMRIAWQRLNRRGRIPRIAKVVDPLGIARVCAGVHASRRGRLVARFNQFERI